ncbi:MAG: arsenite efflux transporter metallochaperone ArsD [Erysipelothrix sp.]
MNIKIYEPALCCSTGICGANVNPELLRITSFVQKCKEQGIEIDRFNLASNPSEFIDNGLVCELMKENQSNLPITLVDNVVFKIGAYPSNDELNELVNQ